MLGLNGVVVKSHGGTDAEGFAHAMDVAMDMVVHRFNDRIRDGLLAHRRPEQHRRGPRLPPRRRSKAGPRTEKPAGPSACRSAPSSPASAAICPSAWSDQRRAGRAGWRRRTTGSATAPASASATSPHRTRPAPSWARRRRVPRLAIAEARAERRGRDHRRDQPPPTRRFPRRRCACRRRWASPGGFGFDIWRPPAPGSSTRCRSPTA